MSEVIEQLKTDLQDAITKIDAQSVQIGDLNTLIAKVAKETDGLKETIAKLEEAIQNGAAVTEVSALVATLRQKINSQGELLATANTNLKAVDDKVADAPVEEPPVEEPPVEEPPANP